MSLPSRFGVIGNPIQHSLSPDIHRQFAAQLGLSIDYQKYSLEAHELKTFVKDFFKHGGSGLNVTLPFKNAVVSTVELLSEEARLAGSVNTLYSENGKICGTTTDGAGLLSDLRHHDFALDGKNLLVVGAGGACQSILVSLLRAGAKVKLLNRSQANAANLVERFSALGEIALYRENDPFDGVISSISEFNPQLMQSFAAQIHEETFCYDLNYGTRAAEFLTFATAAGCRRTSDGLGMLLGQAAESFQIWTGYSPDISKVKLTTS